MKHIFSLICFAFAITAHAQQQAEIEVIYTEYQPNMRTGQKDGTSHQYILLARGDYSKFFSPRTEYLDSLNSTPEGKSKYQEIARSAYLGGKIEDVPRADGSYYVVRSATDNKLYYYDKVGTERLCYEEDIPQLNWAVSDSTKTILGYECFLASADYHGRKWIVWFSPEIPVAAGPWKLQGVPGLILEASTEDELYRFVADGIQQTEKLISPIYLANEYEKTDRVKFLKAKRGFMDNPVGAINAQFSGSGVSIRSVKLSGDSDSGSKIFISRETVDFIETDY